MTDEVEDEIATAVDNADRESKLTAIAIMYGMSSPVIQQSDLLTILTALVAEMDGTPPFLLKPHRKTVQDWFSGRGIEDTAVFYHRGGKKYLSPEQVKAVEELFD